MSDLQIVLMIIGALIIVAVLVLNWWQERRFHQQVQNSFSNLENDALLQEPELNAAALQDIEDDFSIKEAVLPEHALVGDDDHFIELGSIQSDRIQLESKQDSDTLNEDVAEVAVAAIPEPAADGELVHIETTTKSPTPPAADAAGLGVAPLQHEGIKAIFNEAFSNAAAGVKNLKTTDVTATESEVSAALEAEVSVPTLPAMLHAQIDLVAVLYLAAESTAGELSKMLAGLFDDYDKPVFVHFFDSDMQWLQSTDISANPALSNHKITKVSCSLQLADRAGPVTRSVLNRFQHAVETLGLDINAHVEWQSTGDALAAATALDAFCIDVDKTMGFHLVHGENGAFTGTKLRGLSEAQGMELAADGTFQYFDEAAGRDAPQFVVFNRDQHPFSPDMLRSSVVKAITFQLDIPHVRNCMEAFNHMVQVAKQMEVGLHAHLQDDNNKPLGDIQIEKIRHQLKVIHATMVARGIVPGSDSAHRLFS